MNKRMKESGNLRIFERNLRTFVPQRMGCFCVVKNELNCSVTLKGLLKLKSYQIYL